MKIKKRINRIYKYRIKPRLQKAIGFDEFEDSIYLFLNSVTDITKCKPATGYLRTLQLMDSELLKIVDIICRKNNITYWLDWGTLLGAVRHKGFVPWDDDLDITLPLKDYYALYDRLKDFCSEHPDFILSDENSVDRSWMWLNHRANGSHIDIYPIRCICADPTESEESILQKIKTVWEADNTHFRISDQPNDKCELSVYYYPKDVYKKTVSFTHDAVFPLIEKEFEGFSFFIPNDYHQYLTKLYGEYMNYPRNGALHHKGLLDCASDAASELLSEYNELKNIRSLMEGSHSSDAD